MIKSLQATVWPTKKTIKSRSLKADFSSAINMKCALPQTDAEEVLGLSFIFHHVSEN